MHYCKRNFGDYAKKAGRLSMLQHGAYTLLRDSCYSLEQFPTLAEAIEWTWASTTEEIEAVTFVLRKFFVLENGVYIEKEIQQDLEKYQENSETNKRIAIEREANRRIKRTNRAPSDNEPPPNQEPRTKNQEPLTKKTKKTKPPVASENYSIRKYLLSEGIPVKLADDWMKTRKDKKLADTETAMDGVLREVKLSGMTLEAVLILCCERGWGGFKYNWLVKPDNGYPNAAAPAVHVAKPILPVEVQVPSLSAVRGEKPANIGSLAALITKREEAP